MIQKIKAFFTRGSKVEKVLLQIYNGLFITTKALNSVIEAIEEIENEKQGSNPENNKTTNDYDNGVISTLNSVVYYADEAMKAMGKILDIFGYNPKISPASLSVSEKLSNKPFYRSGVVSPSNRLGDIANDIAEIMADSK